MADHGWQLGEHDSWHKQTNFVNIKSLTPTLAPSTVADERVAFSQELGARVPLLIKVPWLRATSGGKTTPVLAELIDIFPTLAILTEDGYRFAGNDETAEIYRTSMERGNP